MNDTNDKLNKLLDEIELADNEEIVEYGDNYFVIEETICYTRRRKVHTVICQLPACPFCQNKPVPAKHPNRKWCSIDAREEFRRRERAREAIDDGRIPGSEGRPSEDIDIGQQTIFYILLLDELNADADDENVYIIGTSETQEAFRQFTRENNLRGKFETVILIRTYQAQQLVDKIQQRHTDKCKSAEPLDHYYLKGSDVRQAHQLANEHAEAFNRIASRKK